MWRRLGLVVAAFALIGAAPPTPEAIVEGVYREYIAASAGHGPEPTPPESLYTPRLRALVAAARKAAAPMGDAPCGLDFVFWVDGQDQDIRAADVTERAGPDAATRIVVAKFMSLREAHELHFTFKNLAGRWRLDDVQSVIGTKWVFSRQLQCLD